MGVARAKRFLMTGDVITAAEALAQGLVEQVVDGAELERETAALAQRLAEVAPLSLAATKEIAASFLTPMPSVRDGVDWYREAYGSRDLQEGLDALLTKRRPTFTGT
jgi:enoyl-CoA hydratase/carnithine racemase